MSETQTSREHASTQPGSPDGLGGRGRLRVLCVDDNRLVADAIAVKLRLAGGFEWLGCLESADRLPEVALGQKPDIILLDLDMPGRDPLEAAMEAGRGGATGRVIVFSGHIKPDLVDRAVRAGAWGYISKSDGENALLEGIRSVAADEFVLSPEVQAVCGRR